MDLTGRQQMPRNVLVTWIAYLFVLVAGFIVPRQINDSLGQHTLGIWDLTWGITRYLTLTRFGVGVALSRHAALYRAKGDFTALNRAMTAVTVWQFVIGVLVCLIAFAGGHEFVNWAGIQDPTEQRQASLVFLLVLLNLATNMFITPVNALMTGYHRWDLVNGLNGLHDALLAAVMIALLLTGHDLVALAWAVFAMGVLSALYRLMIISRVCPGVHVTPAFWDWKTAKDMLRFGIKMMISTIPSASIFQITSILVAGTIGPSALAILNRGNALIRQSEQIIVKLAGMLTPITSSRIGAGEQVDHYGLLKDGVKICFALILPLMIVLGFFGEDILRLWMGNAYAKTNMMLVLAVGALIPIAFNGAASVLIGLNEHGQMALYSLFATIVVLPVCIATLNVIGWSVMGAAVAISVSWTIARGLAISFFIKRQFKVTMTRQLFDMSFEVLVYNGPLLALALCAKFLLNEGLVTASLLTLACGGFTTLIVYWFRLLPQQMKLKIFEIVLKRRVGS